MSTRYILTPKSSISTAKQHPVPRFGKLHFNTDFAAENGKTASRFNDCGAIVVFRGRIVARTKFSAFLYQLA